MAEKLNHFRTTGRVAGHFTTKNGNSVVTIVTKSGRDAFIKVLTNEKDIPKNGTRVEAEGYVSRRTGKDNQGRLYHAQCFIADKFGPEKTAAEKEFGTENGGMFYDDPYFVYDIAGEVQHVEGDDFKRVLVKTERPDGTSISVWLSMKTPKNGFPVKAGDNARFTTGVYTGNRRHETLTITDILPGGENIASDDTGKEHTGDKEPEEKVLEEREKKTAPHRKRQNLIL